MYYVYILTNKNNSVLYTGMTYSLEKRVSEHYYRKFKGFTSKYNVNKLVFYETYLDWRSAFVRERQIKRWSRVKKLKLINMMNKDLVNLAE
ncbi:MAG: GIY-YIG nuclease family protein [Candidatus Dojkabacteria bacterium]